MQDHKLRRHSSTKGQFLEGFQSITACTHDRKLTETSTHDRKLNETSTHDRKLKETRTATYFVLGKGTGLPGGNTQGHVQQSTSNPAMNVLNAWVEP